uniref:AMP-binding protein n=1 Tax=Caedibacter taeniospiralis TaxID=28907 RepID=UPI0037C19476
MTHFRLTKQQQELWYAYRLNPKGDNYNIAVSYRISGNFDKEKFKLIYQTIGNYFEAFRTQFIEKDGEAGQIILDDFKGEFVEQMLNDWSCAPLLHYPASQARHPFTSEGELSDKLSKNSPSLAKWAKSALKEANNFASLALSAVSSARSWRTMRSRRGSLQSQQKRITPVDNTTTEPVLKTLEELRAKPFDLEKDCLFRAMLITVDDQTHYFQFVWHHIVTDGLTTSIFSRVFEKLYNEVLDAIHQFKTYPLADYLQYEEKVIAEKKQEAIEYWKTCLQGAQQKDLAKYTEDNTGKVERKRIDIDPKALSRFLKAHKTTPFIFFNALISTFIYRCFHLTDIMLSYPKNIRPSEFSHIVGYFVSMFPLRVKLSADMTFTQLLDHTRDQYQSSKPYQSIPFEHLKSSLDVDFMPNVSVVETHLVSPDMQLVNVKSESNRFFYGGTVEKLSLAYDKVKLIYEIAYNTNYIPAYFVEYFKALINEVLTNANRKLTDYELVSVDQKKLLCDWNKTDTPDHKVLWSGKPYPKDKTIHQLFEEQVAKAPDNVAVVFEGTPDHNNDGINSFCGSGKQLTYAELNAKANQLARYLRSLSDIQPDSFIALCLDKSLEMIIGILGILKSGAAYVPIDPNYPDERIRYILKDTKATCLLTQSHYVAKLKTLTNAQLVAVNNNCYQDLSTDNLPPQSTSDDLAYVIYTSGTTGQPKGVLLPHKNIVSLAVNNFIKVSNEDTFAYLSSPVFDASIFELWTPLLSGAKLIVPDNAVSLASNIKSFKSL